jgi:hypothetical protein
MSTRTPAGDRSGATLDAASGAAAISAPNARRAFLRRLSGSAAVLGMPALLAACGGGGGDGGAAAGTGSPLGGGSQGGGDGGSGGNGGNGGSGGGGSGGTGGSGATIDPAVRAATIAAVESHCRTLSKQQPALTPLAFAEAVAAKLRTDAAYAEVGVDGETQCAWGVFTDGRLHLVAGNFIPQRRAGVQSAPAAERKRALAAALSEVPAAATARVMQSFGPMFDGADVVTDVIGWLQEKGWQVPHGAEHEAPLSALRALGGVGYFYINTHGGAGAPTLQPFSGESMYSIQSSTKVSLAEEWSDITRDDLAARRLTYFTAYNGDLILDRWPDWDTRYGITANFVDTYWKFAADSVVIMNACSSTKITHTTNWAASFIFAVHKAGAGVYLGWNDTCSPAGAYRAARYFTDRMLGANRFQPEVPAQRPFPWDAVLGDMKKKSFELDPNTGATFQALPNPGSTNKQLLAPSIRHVEVDEYLDELRLIGRFGSKEGEVTIGGQRRPVKTWAPERIVVELPRTGAGSRGAVQVVVRGVKSNLRQLTEWTIPMQYTYAVLERFGLVVDGPGTVRLRADVGGTRDVPGEVPVQSTGYAYDTRDSQFTLTGRGAMPTPKCTLVWTGQATYMAIPEAGYPHSLMAYMKVDTVTKQGFLGLALGAPTPPFVQTGCGTTDGIAAHFGTLDAQVSYPTPLEGRTDVIPLHSAALSFGPDYRIVAGRSETQVARVVWPEVVPVAPPLASDGV